VDGAQAQISRNVLETGDWVTMRLDGIKDLEKPPLLYWTIAASFRIFGTFDWSARIPTCFSAILLCWLVTRMAARAAGPESGTYAGISLGTSIGLWLFTRVLLSPSQSRCGACSAHSNPTHSRWWALGFWAATGAGILAKGLIAALFPIGAALLYLLFSGRAPEGDAWRRLSVFPGLMVLISVAAPWHIAATLRNPPYLDFTLHGGIGYRGFFWFYFLNEHVLRFLNLRYPHDYTSVPTALFWLLHVVWLFPWSAFLVRAVTLDYGTRDAASRLRLLALCWIGIVLAFFSFSSTQEYYSMPAYPAFAILIGSAIAESGKRSLKWCTRSVSAIAGLAFGAMAGILYITRMYPTPGDISQALTQHPGDYTMSLGHMGDLTIQSFAYLRLPLALAGIAMLAGVAGGLRLQKKTSVLALALMMVLFFQAARIALIEFEPDLGSKPLADALNRAPQGRLLIDDPYFEMSSLLFYTNRTALILNGRINNLEYGSHAPGAPDAFIEDAGFVTRWKSSERWYVATENAKVRHLQDLVGAGALHEIINAGGKSIFTNFPIGL
jgi:hypothetical protein